MGLGIQLYAVEKIDTGKILVGINEFTNDHARQSHSVAHCFAVSINNLEKFDLELPRVFFITENLYISFHGALTANTAPRNLKARSHRSARTVVLRYRTD